MKFCLVTGAAGYIARKLIPLLLQRGIYVVAVDRKSCPEVFMEYPEICWVKADCSAVNVMEKIFSMYEFSLCFHLSRPAGFSSEMNLEADRHIELIRRHLVVFDLAVRYGNIPVVFTSSDSVYGPNISSSLLEGSNLQPVTGAGLYFQTLEQYARYYSLRFGLSVVSLRLFNVYGNWLPRWRGDVVSRFCQSALDMKPVQIYGSGLQQRDFIHIDDVVAALLLFVQGVRTGFNSYNICTSVATPVNALVEILSSLMGVSLEIERRGYRYGDVNSAVGNNQKIFRDYDFRPKIEIAQGLRWALNDAGVITMQRASA